MKTVDYLIVGHGLAGATLAWQFEKLGKSIAVVDRESASTASRVAAGLISPIAGKRNAVSHRFDEFWHEASEFYRCLEETTGTQFLHYQRTLKVEQDDASDESSLTLEKPYRALPAKVLENASRLDVVAFLDASRRWLRDRGDYFRRDLDLANDVAFIDSRVDVAALSLSCKSIVFCQGIDAQSNPWLSQLSFEPVKGEILEVESTELASNDTVLGDVWVVPSSSNRCLVGATYERDFEDPLPSDAGRESILRRLNELVELDATVVDHRAAIRPTLTGRLPKIGVPQRQIAFFNGLGSKGALRAPLVARQLAEHLVLGHQVDREFWLDLGNARSNRRLTEVAQAAILPVLNEGDIAIDATVGNGFDTLFLSQSVGESGHVFGIDLQREAIKRTEARLAAADVQNVTLICGSHADVDGVLPSAHHGCVAAVMFNLGYLPRGDKDITTKTESTLEAIKKSVEMLRSGGVLSVVAYTGHAGGMEETEAVESLLMDAEFRRICHVTLPPMRLEAGPPRHYLIAKI